MKKIIKEHEHFEKFMGYKHQNSNLIQENSM